VVLRNPGARGREALDEHVDELALDEHRVGAGFGHRAMERGGLVTGEGDHAHARVIAAQARDGGDAVQARHVQVDDDRVGSQLLRELDCREAVACPPDDGELRLPLDQRRERFEKRTVVVREENLDHARRSRFPHPVEVSLVGQGMQQSRRVTIIGAALDLGAGRRGVDMGPSAIRYAGLDHRLAALGYDYVDRGNVGTAVAEAIPVGDEHARFLPEIKATCRDIADLVRSAVDDGSIPLVLGGDHSVALGTLGGLREAEGPGGVLWIDAHGDLNSPETSPSGNVHGMVLAAALGLAGDRFKEDGWALPAVASGRVALVGVRSLDDGERELLRNIDARVFTMSDVDRLGVERVLREALAHVSGPGFVHVSLDMDVVDPDVAPGVGTPVRGGLSYREAHLALELVAEAGIATSLDVVEVNPILDRENETGKLAVELVASALGARIL
jgi:arginase